MPQFEITSEVQIIRDSRVAQVEGMFDVAPSERSVSTWSVNLPVEERDWQIGLIVGPSGCGKSTVARKAFGEHLVDGYEWDPARAVVSQFPDELEIKEITGALSAVGFSSPPSWLRPFGALSNGEQFRVTLARAMCEPAELFAIDEFTSVVDRTVARIGSCAVSKAVRATKKRMVAIACHYDILEWLQPDWTYEPAGNVFTWRSLRRRPDIKLVVRRVDSAAWDVFKKHHYLDAAINPGATCFVAFVEGQPAAFTSVIFFPHPTASAFKGHRTVCLPDFQGCGIGNALINFVAGLYRAKGRPFISSTSHPAMIAHRARSPLWKMTRKPKLVEKKHRGLAAEFQREVKSALGRKTASFEFRGRANREDAVRFGIVRDARERWEQGIRVRWGRHMQLLQPGVHLRLPFIDQVYVQSVRQRISVLGRQTVTNGSGETITFNANLGYQIEDMAKSAITDYIVTHPCAECAPKLVEEHVNAKLDLSQFGLGNVRIYLTEYAKVRTYRLIGDHGGYFAGTSLDTTTKAR